METLSLAMLSAVLGTIVVSVDACGCPAQTDEEKICQTNYAALIYVHGKARESGDDTIYTVQTIRTYRAKMGMAVDRRHVHIDSLSMACGHTLQAGKYYIISAEYETLLPFIRRLRTDVCSLLVQIEWTRVSSYKLPACSDKTLHFKYGNSNMSEDYAPL